MNKLNYKETIVFWRKNDEAKKDLDRLRDPEGLTFGLYDDFPLWINRYYAFFQNRVIRRFLEQIPFREDGDILEIGCGSGRWCRRLSQFPHSRIIGLDISCHMLKNNKKLYGKHLDFLCASASALPLKSETFDLLFSVAVIHHLPPSDQESAVREIRRVLRRGRYFFMVESTEVNSPSCHLYARKFDDWRSFLEDQDFRIVDSMGQEYIDFRKIIRPFRRKLRAISDGVLEKRGSLQGDATKTSEDLDRFKVNAPGLSSTEKIFHLLFSPFVYACYPIELGLQSLNLREMANYACVLAQKK